MSIRRWLLKPVIQALSAHYVKLHDELDEIKAVITIVGKHDYFLRDKNSNRGGVKLTRDHWQADR